MSIPSLRQGLCPWTPLGGLETPLPPTLQLFLPCFASFTRASTLRSERLPCFSLISVLMSDIWGLHSNFVDCQSFVVWNSPEIVALCGTDLDDWIYSGNFSVRVYLPFIRRDSNTHMHGLAVSMKGLLFARDLALENSADSYLCFWLGLLQSLPSFFFLYRSPSLSLCTVYDFISSNIDEVLSMNPERSCGDKSMLGKFLPK